MLTQHTMAVRTFNSLKWQKRVKLLLTVHYLLLMDCSALSEVIVQYVLSVTDAWPDNQLEELQGGNQPVCVRQDAFLYFRAGVSSLD